MTDFKRDYNEPGHLYRMKKFVTSPEFTRVDEYVRTVLGADMDARSLRYPVVDGASGSGKTRLVIEVVNKRLKQLGNSAIAAFWKVNTTEDISSDACNAEDGLRTLVKLFRRHHLQCELVSLTVFVFFFTF